MAKVLLVDDDPKIVEAGKEALERAGHAVLTASDARSALELLPQVEAVVTDLHMPYACNGMRMDKPEWEDPSEKTGILVAFEAMARTLPVVMISSEHHHGSAQWVCQLLLQRLSNPKPWGGAVYLEKSTPSLWERVLDNLKCGLSKKKA